MKQTSMILMSDYYKQAHAEQYPQGISKLISYATARMTRIPKEMLGDKLVVFGIQSYVKDFLLERFNETFFNVPLEEAMAEYKEIIGETFPIQYVDTGKFEALHKLGYLPIEIGCLAEGTRVPIRSAFELPEGQCQIPFMYIINTHPDFPWITEFLESVTSSEIWYPMAVANQAYYYRQIVNEWYEKTGCDNNARKSAISEFGFRGGKSSDAAIKASSAFLTSFNKTATIPAIKYMHDYYGDPVKEIGSGMISTEHSVMCSNYAVDSDINCVDFTLGNTEENLDKLKSVGIGDIIKNNAGLFICTGILDGASTPLISDIQISDGVTTWYFKEYEDTEAVFLKRLFSELYPTGNVSVVMDTYDYWANLQRCGKGELYDVIMNREGTVFFRGDSGDPVDIICGERVHKINKFELITSISTNNIFVENENTYYTCKNATIVKCDETPVEVVGTVELLAKMFGYTVNEKGYKVLDNHVRAIYGDSITPRRAKEIYSRLAEKGFAACNVALGAGSFSTQCAEDSNGRLLPFTRDTYGIAVKATWCQGLAPEKLYKSCQITKELAGKRVILDTTKGLYRVQVHEDGSYDMLCEIEVDDIEEVVTERQLFKNPKTDTGKFKKSQKGLIWVGYDEDGEIIARDGYTTSTLPKDNLLQPIFRDGKMLKETTLAEIREKLHNEDF